MKTLTRLFLCAALLATALAARADRVFNQAELDALLAPVALYPDAVLTNILVAASYPDEVHEAAAWTRANPQLRGDEALDLVQNTPWQPSVKALVATPEILARMDESPQWLADLGEAYRVHGYYVMDTVQALRQRAQANGYPQTDYAPPAVGGYVYVHYYDPYVVYGPWWWPAYRPIVWRPFAPVFVINRPVVVHRPVVIRRPPVVHGPVVVQHPVVHAQFRNDPPPRRDNGGPSPAQKVQQDYARDRAKARPPQQGSNRGTGQAQRQHNFQQSQQPKGKFGPPDNRGQRQGNQGRGGRHD